MVAIWVDLENVDFLGSGAAVEKGNGPIDNKNNDKPFRISHFQTNVSEPNINLNSLLWKLVTVINWPIYQSSIKQNINMFIPKKPRTFPAKLLHTQFVANPMKKQRWVNWSVGSERKWHMWCRPGSELATIWYVHDVVLIPGSLKVDPISKSRPGREI